MKESKQEHIVEFYGDKYGVRADFSQASDNIEILSVEEGWKSSQYQVADFRHRPYDALRRQIEESVSFSGEDPTTPENSREIDEAMGRMEE
jgi:hypothetical protein